MVAYDTLTRKVNEYLTVREVAEMLRVAEKTVRNWIAGGKVKAARVTRRSGWRIRRSEVERLMAESDPGARVV